MPQFSPFAGVRYDCEAAGTALDTLVAPPYDVVDDDQRAALEAAGERNAVRLILPRDGSREGDRYDRAAAAFERWRADGALVTEDRPVFYSYRMRFRDGHGRPRHTQGVIGALALPDGDRDRTGEAPVLPHERTLAKAKSDRLSLLRATRVNLDPIWGLTLGEGLTERLGGARALCSCTDPDGVVHELGSVDDAATVDEIAAIVRSAPLVLADGHHRFETACAFRDEVRAAGQPVGGAAAIMTFVVELVEDELSIEAIHRLVELPDGVDIRARLADAFELHDAGALTIEAVDALEERMLAEGALGLADARGLALARPRADVRAAALADEHPAVAATDAAVVEALIAPRLPEARWQYRHDAHAVVAAVEKGAATATILCRPVSVAQTRAAAVDRVRMPQKTTFFSPKPRTGMVFRPLDSD